VVFAGGAEERPAGDSEGSGPGGVAAPDLLEHHDVGTGGQPLDDLTNGCVRPREAVNIVCYEPQHPLLAGSLLLAGF
jgi:hypothetical protein